MTKNTIEYNKAYDLIRSKAQQIVGSQKLYRQLEPYGKKSLRNASKKLLLLSDIDNTLQRYNDSKVRFSEGFIYLAINQAWPEWIKVGRTKDPKARLNAYQTSSPLRDYKILIKAQCTNTQKTEASLLDFMAESADEINGEWFKINQQTALMLFANMVKGV